ncbi:MAG: arginine deiminase family protein [Oscillospiraceae bacterium]
MSTRKFSNAIVRLPGHSISEGLLSLIYMEGRPNYAKAIVQHEEYVAALAKAGVDVTVLPACEDFASSVFIEDNALLTDKVAIISNPGAPTRNGEVRLPDLRPTLAKFYDNIEQITAGTVEPGDIMMVGNDYYIGISKRTTRAGAEQMASILKKYGHNPTIVELKEMFHLKSGVNYLENNNLLVAGEFIDNPLFKDFNKVEIPEDEMYAANCVWVNDYVLVPEGYPKVKKIVEDMGYKTIVLGVSELRKTNGGLSCISLRF